MLRLTKRETFKLNKNIRVDKTINKIADGIVKSIKDGIEKTSTDINGSGFAKLSPNTIASKKMRGLSYPKKPLYAEGKMKEVYVKTRAIPTKKLAIVSVNKRDRKIPSAVHNTGVGSYTIKPKKKKMLSFYTTEGWANAKEVKHTGQKKREWFGIGKVQVELASKIAQADIKKALM